MQSLVGTALPSQHSTPYIVVGGGWLFFFYIGKRECVCAIGSANIRCAAHAHSHTNKYHIKYWFVAAPAQLNEYRPTIKTAVSKQMIVIIYCTIHVLALDGKCLHSWTHFFRLLTHISKNDMHGASDYTYHCFADPGPCANNMGKSAVARRAPLLFLLKILKYWRQYVIRNMQMNIFLNVIRKLVIYVFKCS